jgi:hypothetical protein
VIIPAVSVVGELNETGTINVSNGQPSPVLDTLLRAFYGIGIVLKYQALAIR